jgi:Ca2+-binding EF-hand superfamily protein
MTEVFFFIDANKDGSLTIDELKVVGDIDPVKFKLMDRDDNQSLSLHEYLYGLHNDFDEADRDKDGTLDVEELRLLIGK